MKSCGLVVFFLIYFINANSQIVVSTSTGESRCSATGTITVTASGGIAPYQYATTSGPTLKPNQSSNIITSLAPGTYSVRVTDNLGATITRTGVVVAGTYTLMSPSSVQTTPTCPGGSDGKITITIPTATGRSPYGFQLIAPSPVTTSIINPGTNSYAFTGLPAGSYTYQVSDSCGNVQTRNVTVNNPAPPTLTVNHANDFLFQLNNCGSVDLYSGEVRGGTAPYSLQVYLNGNTSPATTLTSSPFTVATGLIMSVPYTSVTGGKHSFRLTDACGQVYTNTFITDSVNLTTSSLPTTCSMFNNFAATTWGFKGPITLSLFNGTGTAGALYYSETLSNGSAFNYSKIIEAVPAGTYTLQVTDVCGRTATKTANINNKPPKSINYSFDKRYSGLDSTTGVLFTANQFLNKPVRFTWLSGTASFTSADNKFSGTRSYPFDTSFTVFPNTPIYTFANVPMGTYKVAVTDSCGWTDTLNFTVGAADVQTMNFIDSVQPGCINDNKILASITTLALPRSASISLYRIVSPGVNSLISTVGFTPANFTQIFTGLLSNTDYIIRYSLGSAPFLFGSNISRVDTFHTPVYVPPSISASLPVACPGTSTGSFVLNANGISPFQYAITAGPVTRPNQSSNIFNGLPASAIPYTIRVTDACLNTNSYNYSLSPISIPPISASVLCASLGNTFTLSADSVHLTSYTWTGPAGTFNTRSFTIPTVSAADTGIYTLSVVTMGCVTPIIENFHLESCSLMPLRLLGFTAKLSGNAVQLQWITTDEVNMDKFIIERSANGKDWVSIGSLPVRNNASEKEVYAFSDNINNSTLVFYRIKIIENTGTYSYSSVAKIIQSGNINTAVVYPNPASSTVTISLSGYKHTVTGQLYNATGQLQTTINLTNGTNNISVEGLSNGLYNLIITDETGEIKNYKLIVKH